MTNQNVFSFFATPPTPSLEGHEAHEYFCTAQPGEQVVAVSINMRLLLIPPTPVR